MNEESTNLVERVRFGTFELNVRTGELVSIGTESVEPESAKVLLREQPFRILRILVERQGQMVTRQEIRQILWPNDTFVDYERSINVQWRSCARRSQTMPTTPSTLKLWHVADTDSSHQSNGNRVRQLLRTCSNRNPK